MRAVVVIALLIFAAGLAWADSVEVSESNLSIVYIDPSAIRKNGNLRRVWILQDMKVRDPRGALSMGSLREYDCKRHRSRALSLSTHLGSMPNWHVEPNGNEVGGQWNPIEIGTTAGAILKFVCAR